MDLNLMDPKLMVLAAAVILLIAVLAWLYMRKRRSTTADLRQKFGPEYERAVKEHGSERKAEAKLADREKRVEKLTIRDLDPLERERFSKQWASVQSRFVDSPKGAVAEADDLVSSLMKTRGYPVSDFDQRAADISVDHPRVVENYRSAHEIALRVGKDAASTEDLRTAMIHYRSLFEELVQVVYRLTTRSCHRFHLFSVTKVYDNKKNKTEVSEIDSSRSGDRVNWPRYNERRKFKRSCCCDGLSALKLLMTP